MYINNPGHMTKMAAMPIYGKNPSKIFFSRTGGSISKKLGMKHRWLKYYNARPSSAVRPVRPWPDHIFGRNGLGRTTIFDYSAENVLAFATFLRCGGPILSYQLILNVLGQSARGRERRSL